MEQVRWDYPHLDGNWPGIGAYLREGYYDTSKVGTNVLVPVQDENIILDSRVGDSERCKRPNALS